MRHLPLEIVDVFCVAADVDHGIQPFLWIRGNLHLGVISRQREIEYANCGRGRLWKVGQGALEREEQGAAR